MKIYTKTGDTGQTGLLGGIRVSKSHQAIQVCGELDEASSLIGIALSFGLLADVSLQLQQIQNDLFDLGSRVAACQSTTSRAARFPVSRSEQLERWIDDLQTTVPELKEFILPGGMTGGAFLHFARAVCRRAERSLVVLMEQLSGGGQSADASLPMSVELVYLNRLSDLLFVQARWVNHHAGASETKWKVTV